MVWSAGLGKHFRDESLVWTAGACSALTARLVERSGFDAVWVSGLEVSASLGLPDIGLLTMTEMMDVTRQMTGAVSVPVIVDGDTGFGDELNVVRLMRSAVAAGATAVCVEDKVFPKRNSFLPVDQELLGPERFCRKLRSAREAAGDELSLIARTESLVAGGDVEEALFRSACYVDAGADAVLVHSRDSTPDRIVDFLRKWRGSVPVIVVPTTYHGISARELEMEGAGMVIYANHGLRSAVRAIGETLSAIRASGSTAGVEDKIASLGEVFRLQETDSWLELRT
ncbi:isocitrate lyase/phosphoenolpyruvate mutase family protein [Actinomadura rubrisoli]|uniref:Phosphoenolpyruvate phosphomutase n=1 Tax=Actinomadura rubrisoli TaxID=2530368 RepID=A0A4R5A8T0_9ACTN|nr:isocitrate lyase/phosphoenolpyruvate mutase family protein [Actinomadura rubrisoli]TDD68668.1 phosphoenolpyruvate phosphomutase [Actinomadura rubrisoli]